MERRHTVQTGMQRRRTSPDMSWFTVYACVVSGRWTTQEHRTRERAEAKRSGAFL